MRHSFHPYPIVGIVKTIFGALLFSVISFVFLGAVAILFSLIVAAISLLVIAVLVIRAQIEEITLDDNTITYRKGILSQKTVVLSYDQITEASYDQGAIDRLLNIGNLRVDTAGGSHMAIYVQDIKYSDLKKTVDEIHEMGNKG